MTIFGKMQPFVPVRILSVLAAVLFFFASLSPAACSAENNQEPTPRQKEILGELGRFRPGDGQSDGVDGIWMLGTWDSDAGLDSLIPIPAGGGNAAACFKRLEELYPAEKSALEGEDGGVSTQGVDVLLEAGRMGECRLIPDYYPEFVTTDARQPDFQILRTYQRALLRRGEEAERRGDAMLAEECFRAAMICGRHLTNDKSSGLVFMTGLIFKLRGAQAYAGFLGRTGRPEQADAAKQYEEWVSTLLRAFVWKANVALGEFDNFACLPTVVRIATGDKEAFWRKEAVVRLATLRYGIPDAQNKSILRNPVFERVADQTLTDVAANDPDPTVRRLAIWVAKNVIPQNYQDMEHKFF